MDYPKLIHGDCLEEMKKLPSRSVDCFICDLPYGCLTGGAGKEKAKRKQKGSEDSIAGCDWDQKIDLEKFWEQVERLMKDDNTPIIHFCNIRFGVELIASKPSWFRYDLVWNKERGVSFLTANKMPMKSHENIFVFSKKGARYNRVDVKGAPYSKKSKGEACPQYKVKRTEAQNEGTRCVLSVINCLNSAGHHRVGKKGDHPTQKPADLYRWLLERYSKEGDVVLDPTAGSFTSVETAAEMGRKAIGIEMNEAFFKKAKERMAPGGAESGAPT